MATISYVLTFRIILLLAIHEIVDGIKILAIFPYPSRSQYDFVLPYMRALAANEHKLTIINSVPNRKDEIKEAQIITITDIYNLHNELVSSDFELPFTKWHEAQIVSQYYYNLTNLLLKHAEVQNLLQNSADFEIVIMEAEYFDALYGFAQHFQVPIVGITLYGASWNIDYLAGNSAPTVYQPMSPIGYKPGFNLIERLQNFFFITEEWLLQKLIYVPKQHELYKKYFPAARVPLQEMRRNFSLIMINQHFSLGRPRSNVPNIVEIAGMHIPEILPTLHEELETFIAGATHGIIYFSMGADIQSRHLPKGTLDIFLATFKRLKQRIIWKFESENILNKSAHIYFSHWLPQMSLLAHPKVKLFITHGGLLSIIEAAHYGKPVIGLPLFYDQFNNIAHMEKLGAGKALDLNTLNARNLYETINTMLYDPTYASNAHMLSQRFRDQPMRPLQNAIWWTEYVMRHKGALHMHLDEHDLAFFHYYALDTTLAIFGRIVLPLIIALFAAYKMYTFTNKFLPFYVGDINFIN